VKSGVNLMNVEDGLEDKLITSLTMHSTTLAKRRTHSSRGNKTSTPVGCDITQTTSVGEVTAEVHTSVASVEAPRKTRRNRKSDCVVIIMFTLDNELTVQNISSSYYSVLKTFMKMSEFLLFLRVFMLMDKAASRKQTIASVM
jgi:hypothetical protein